MLNDSTPPSSARPAAVLMSLALTALLIGTMVYALTRTQPPSFLAMLPHVFGTDITPIAMPFSGQLPSLLHALALILATAAIAPTTLRRAAMAITVGLALMMEFVQHPAVQHWASTWSSSTHPLLMPLKEYSIHGTYDVLDVLAIVVALAVASPLLGCHRSTSE